MITMRLRLLMASMTVLCLPAALMPPPAAAVAPRTNRLAPFTAPVTVGTAVAGASPQEVVADGLGVLDVWVGGTAAAERVFVRRWLPSGGWGPAVALSGAMTDISLQASSSGDAAVVGWSGRLASGQVVAQAAVRPTRLGSWTKARNLGPVMSGPSVSATGSDVAVTWLAPAPGGFAVDVATWTLLGPSATSGAWAPTVVLQTGISGLVAFGRGQVPRGRVGSPTVVDQPSGRVVAWRAHDQVTGDYVEAATSVGASGWSAPVRVSADGESCLLEALQQTPQGASVLTSCVRGGSIALDARDWSFLGTPSWGAATTLDDQALPEASQGLWDLDSAWGGSGSSMVAVVWRHVGEPGSPGTVAIHLARRAPDGTWSSAVQMSPTGAVAGGPTVGITGSVALVGWYRMIGTTYGVELRAARPKSLTGFFWATEGVPARYVDVLQVSGTPYGAVVAWQRRAARTAGAGVIEGVSYNDTTGWGMRIALGSGYASSAVASRTSTAITWQHGTTVVASTGSLLGPTPKGVPVITRNGRTLACTPPRYSPVPYSLGAAWFDGGVYIPNATRAVYVVPPSRLGHTFRCRIAGGTMGFRTGITWSAPIRVPA